MEQPSMLLLATYTLALGQVKICFIWLSKKSRETSLLCAGQVLLPAPFSPVASTMISGRRDPPLLIKAFLAESVSVSLDNKLAHCNQSWDPQATTFWKSRPCYQKLWKKILKNMIPDTRQIHDSHLHHITRRWNISKQCKKVSEGHDVPRYLQALLGFY